MHTPEPWYVVPRSSHISISSIPNEKAQSDTPICDVYTSSRPEEGMDNAQLIAASPQLYKLLGRMTGEALAGDVLDATAREAIALMGRIEGRPI